MRSYARDLPQHHDFRAGGFVADPSLAFPDLARDLFAQLRAADGKKLAGATVHNHFDELTRIWPGARFIHLERDPRDVARSCVATGWAAGNVWAAADIWIAADDAWQRLEAHSMLDIEGDSSYRRPSKRDARSWRDDAPPEEVRIMEARFGPRLTRAGYAPSGLPPLRISAARAMFLRLDHRWRRMRASQRRYGFWLWAASAVSRPPARIQALREARKRARATMSRIDELHMR